jgi:hypothetical protein
MDTALIDTQINHDDDIETMIKKDRKLGDQWVGWDGNVENYEWQIHDGKRLFILASTAIFVMTCCLIGLLWYLISPRMVEFGTTVATITNIVAASFIALALFWFAFMMLSVFTEKNFLKIFGSKANLVMAFIPWAAKLAQKFGISRDRFGHSFITVHNALTRAVARIVNKDKLLVLLPRCLTKATFQSVKALGEKYGVTVFIAPGGDIARKMVQETQPMAIIGVACERDLVSGIVDVAPYIPVLGVPNIRPEGPCKHATVNLEDLEKAIQFFLGKK